MAYPYRFSPNAEVFGAGMSALFNHYRREDVIDSLTRHGLDYFEPDGWYPVDRFINLLAEWSKMAGSITTLVSVGMAMTYHIELPDDIALLSGLEKIMLLGDMHVQQHRSGDVGAYTVERTDENKIRFTENMIWPDDMIYGYIYGTAKRYLDHNLYFSLHYVNNDNRQDMGGSQTVFDLIWGEKE